MKELNTCNFSNLSSIQTFVPNALMETFLLLILTMNSIAFLFSIGWLVFIVKESISLRRKLRAISKNTRDIEVRRNRYNIRTHLHRNLLIVCILVVEALHLIIKGLGFGLFFVFEQLNETDSRFIISSNIFEGFGPIKAYRHFQVTLIRTGFTNGCLLLFIILLSNLMIYLFKAYGEHKDFKKIKLFFIIGFAQFSIVFVLMSIINTTLYGSIILAIFLIIDYIILIRSRNRLALGLRIWQYDGGYYEDMHTFRKRRKHCLRFFKWTRALLISLVIYLFSVLAENVGNWIVMFVLNPLFVKEHYKILAFSESSSCSGYNASIITLAFFFFVLSNIGTLQFDFFLLFSNLIYYMLIHCYFTTPHRDRAVRQSVRNIISKTYYRPLMSDFNNLY